MMKTTLHFLVCTAVFALLTSVAQAQEVFNYVLASATRTVNNPSANYTQTQIAQFKRTALIYLQKKAFEKSDTVQTSLLDNQAYYLSEFITLFFDEITKDKKEADGVRKAKIMLFMDASVMNPLWNDPDKETTQSFLQEEGVLTPFSLDTDWQKAYLAATINLKDFKAAQ